MGFNVLEEGQVLDDLPGGLGERLAVGKTPVGAPYMGSSAGHGTGLVRLLGLRGKILSECKVQGGEEGLKALYGASRRVVRKAKVVASGTRPIPYVDFRFIASGGV